MQIYEEKWTYGPRLRDGRNEERRRRFTSSMDGVSVSREGVVSVDIPFPNENVGVGSFLDKVFEVMKYRGWYHELEDEPESEERDSKTPTPPASSPRNPDSTAISSLEDELLLDRGFLDETAKLLEEKRQVICRGRPAPERPMWHESWRNAWPDPRVVSPLFSSIRPMPMKISCRVSGRSCRMAGNRRSL